MSVNSLPRTVALIEPNAARLGGHWTPCLAGLSRAAADQGRPVAVVALDGIHVSTRERVEAAGAEVVTTPRGPLPTVWRLCAWFFHKCARAAYRARLPNGFRYQLTQVSRSMIEASSLATARRLGSGTERPVCVILTANDGLVGLTARLSRSPHLRYTHEVDVPMGRVLRALERTCAGAQAATAALCPTQGVAAEVRRIAPRAGIHVAPFALRDAVRRIDDAEREPARRRLGLHEGRPTAALVGGWWPYKDNALVVAALGLVTTPLQLIVAGFPVDADAVATISSLPLVTLTALVRELGDDELRSVYAAADYTLVSRVSGVSKESGLVLDAMRYGVPLVVSDNDAELSARLRGEGWVASFTAGDAGSLAGVLDGLAGQPLPRPDPAAAQRFGLRSGLEMLELFDEVERAIPRGAR